MQCTQTRYLLCKVPVISYVDVSTYCNELLSRFNARRQLREKLEESVELKLPSNVLFGEPEQQNTFLVRSNPFSSSAETKYSECAYSTRGRHYTQ